MFLRARQAPFSDAIAYAVANPDALFEVAEAKWYGSRIGMSQYFDLVLFRRTDDVCYVYQTGRLSAEDSLLSGGSKGNLFELTSQELACVRASVDGQGGVTLAMSSAGTPVKDEDSESMRICLTHCTGYVGQRPPGTRIVAPHRLNFRGSYTPVGPGDSDDSVWTAFEAEVLRAAEEMETD
ncbi:MAG: hypothetical protein ACYTKD_24785 [Planctomycetota bacterium]